MYPNEMLSSVRFGEKEVFVETGFDNDNGSGYTKISENGHVLEDFQFKIDEEKSEEERKTFLEDRHHEISEDWRLLSYIHNKVMQSGHVQSLNKLGIILEKRNMVEEAIECFQEAISLDSSKIESYVNLGNASINAGFHDQAIEFLEKAIEIAPDYPDLHFGLGQAYEKKEDPARAIEAFKSAITINENYDAAHFALGMIYLQGLLSDEASETDTAEIITSFRKAQEINDQIDPAIVDEAVEKIEEGDYESALDVLSGIKFIAQDQSENHFDEEFYLRYMFGGKGKDDELLSQYIETLERELDFKPNYPDLHNKLGVAYLIQCRNTFIRAMREFRKALKINPSYKSAKRNLKLAENEGKGFIILLRALLK